jgi:hypothetical protein
MLLGARSNGARVRTALEARLDGTRLKEVGRLFLLGNSVFLPFLYGFSLKTRDFSKSSRPILDPTSVT